jgi:hypothetical protein
VTVDSAPADLALSLRRRLESLGQEAEQADLQFVAYLIGMTITELDDVIAASSKRH